MNNGKACSATMTLRLDRQLLNFINYYSVLLLGLTDPVRNGKLAQDIGQNELTN